MTVPQGETPTTTTTTKKKDNNCVYKKEREKKKVKKKKGRESQVEQRKWPKFWCLKMTAAAPSLLKSVYFLVC